MGHLFFGPVLRTVLGLRGDQVDARDWKEMSVPAGSLSFPTSYETLQPSLDLRNLSYQHAVSDSDNGRLLQEIKWTWAIDIPMASSLVMQFCRYD